MLRLRCLRKGRVEEEGMVMRAANMVAEPYIRAK